MKISNGFFAVIEGINGCGKGIAAQTIGEYLVSINQNGFDFNAYWKTKMKHPEAKDILKYDYFTSAEPTHAWIGRAIRDEMFYNNGRNYTETSMLNAYALDRHILYRRLLVPLKKAGKTIIQERTISTTLAIQTVGDTAVTWDNILNHPDHQYVLKNLPNLMIIINIKPETANTFIKARSSEEDDNDVYEVLERQKKTQEVFNSTRFKNYFTAKGVILEYIDNDGTLDEFKNKVVNVFKKHY